MADRIYHRGALINPRGGVSALCFTKPRAINLKVALWTNRDEAVTCPKCKAAIAARSARVPPEGQQEDAKSSSTGTRTSTAGS